MTRLVTDAERAEVGRRLASGAAAYRVAQEMQMPAPTVRRIRDEMRIPALVPGTDRLAKPEPVRWDDPPEVDGDPASANPRRIPVGHWCVERPDQARWLEMCDKASDVERIYLRDAMCTVLGLRLSATTPEIFAALDVERRYADELAGLYLKARGYGR